MTQELIESLKEEIEKKELELQIKQDKSDVVKHDEQITEAELYELRRKLRQAEANDNYLLKKEAFEKLFRIYFEQNLLKALCQHKRIEKWDGLGDPKNLEYYIGFSEFELGRPNHGKITIKLEWLKGEKENENQDDQSNS